MKKFFMALFIMISLIFCQYSFYPTDGLFLMKDAEIRESGKLRLGTYFLYYPKEKRHYLDLPFPMVAYSLANFLEIGGYYGGTFYAFYEKEIIGVENFGRSSYDGVLCGKVSIPFLPVFKLGTFFSYPLEIRDSIWSLVPILPSAKGKLAYSFLFKLKFSDLLPSLPSILVENGYFKYNNIDYRTLGLGILISAKRLSVFGELFIEGKKEDKIFDFDKNRIRLTPGFNILLGEIFNVGFSVSKRLNELPELPDWHYNLSLSLSSYFLRKPPKKKGFLTGRVLDYETKLPLSAKLILGNVKEGYSDSITGIYNFSKISEGQYVIFVEKDGYYREAIPVIIEGEKTTTIDILLKPIIQYGTIAGRIYDKETNQPLLARISLKEKGIEIFSDSISGSFRIDNIETGIYTLEVEKENYFLYTRTLEIKPKEVQNLEIPLAKKGAGTIAGRIYDKETNQPLLARVLLKEKGIEVFSDSITGGFRIDNIESGVYTLEVIKENYFPYALIVEVKPKEVRNLETPLVKKGAVGIVTGQIFDYKEKKPLKAQVEIKEANLKITTDSLTGIYKLELPVGTYTATVTSEGYISQTAPIIIEKDKAKEKNFYLVKKGMAITLRGIYFDFNKATIKKESYPTLDSTAQILKDNPKIIVEIQGHTDNIGDAEYNKKLSLRRAQAVVDYFVRKHGIDIKRLRAVGYGAERPIADNSTAEGRALNRRVEFVIIEEE